MNIVRLSGLGLLDDGAVAMLTQMPVGGYDTIICGCCGANYAESEKTFKESFNNGFLVYIANFPSDYADDVVKIDNNTFVNIRIYKTFVKQLLTDEVYDV